MKLTYSILFASLVFVACKPKNDANVNEAFEKNSKTVLTYLQGFQNKKVDYSSFSKDFKALNTSFGATDTLSLEQFKESDKKIFASLNFKLVEGTPEFLPGVGVKTKIADGSVRYYCTWEITLPKTDSTEAKTGKLKMYESYDFDDSGKIVYQQGYGDFTGLINYLTKK